MTEEAAKELFQYEQYLLEQYGHISVITFDEWCKIKKIKIEYTRTD